MKSIINKLGYVPDSIMINVPTAFFEHISNYRNEQVNNRLQRMAMREKAFRIFYESMGTLPGLDDDSCFYHFISSVPVIKDIQYAYICFGGFVQYKALVVQFLKNEVVNLPTYKHLTPRDWCITTGPVVKAPDMIKQKGFRGFRYTKPLF